MLKVLKSIYNDMLEDLAHGRFWFIRSLIFCTILYVTLFYSALIFLALLNVTNIIAIFLILCVPAIIIFYIGLEIGKRVYSLNVGVKNG